MIEAMNALAAAALAAALQTPDAATPEPGPADVDAIEAAIVSVHPDPFTRISETEWRAEGERLRQLAADGMDESEIVALMTWVASIGDGHTNLEPSGLTPFARWYPVRFSEFPDGLYITGAQGPGVELNGAHVLAIGGEDALLAARRQAATQGADNMFGALEERGLLSNAGVMEGLGLTGGDGGLTLTLERDGETFETVLAPIETRWDFDWRFWGEFVGPPVSESYRDWQAAYNGAGISDFLTLTPEHELPLHLTYRRPYWFTRVPGDASTVYCGFHFVQNWGDESLSQFVDRLFAEIDTIDTPRLVLDLRHNFGGDGSILLPLVHAVIRSDAINRTGHFYVLTGPQTFSAAVNLVGYLERHTNAVFVGTPPGAGLTSFGDATSVELPSGMTLWVSSVRHQDGYLDESGPVFPIDIPAPMTAEAYFSGGDPALELILSGADLRPVEVIARTEGSDAAIAAARSRMALAEAFGWTGYRPFPEYPVSTVGYGTYLDGDIDGGIALLEMIAEFYPDSSRAHRQLGDAYRAAERMEDARAAYERALELDPYNGEARSGLADL